MPEDAELLSMIPEEFEALGDNEPIPESELEEARLHLWANQPETEEGSERLEALRRLRVRRLSGARPAQTQTSSPSQSNMPETTE
jgi:hypothetical protein